LGAFPIFAIGTGIAMPEYPAIRNSEWGIRMADSEGVQRTAEQNSIRVHSRAACFSAHESRESARMFSVGLSLRPWRLGGQERFANVMRTTAAHISWASELLIGRQLVNGRQLE